MNKPASYNLQATSFKSGFTLIEVLAASGILALVAGAVLVVSQASVRSHDTALERTQAYQLVQEGLEIVHTVRDAAAEDTEPGNWQADFPRDSASVFARWDPTARRYTFFTGSEPIELDGLTFTRTYTFLQPPDLPPLTDQFGTELADQSVLEDVVRRVRVRVAWTSQNRAQAAEGTTLLTDWRQGG